MPDPTHLAQTRLAYDTVAENYARDQGNRLDMPSPERTALDEFAALTTGAVLDVGCGPGLVAAYLASLGLEVSGVDLSPEMVSAASVRYPGIRFSVGSMQQLPAADASLGGVIAWYSIIHTPPGELQAVFAEFHRALAPGGVLGLGFQVGDERRRIEQGYGHTVSLDAYRLMPEAVWQLLERAGFMLLSTTVREPDAAEKVPQAYLLARR